MPLPAMTSAATMRLAALGDNLPEWLGSMTVKELRQGMRARLFVVPFATIHAAALAAIFSEFAMRRQSAAGLGPFDSIAGEAPFWTLAAIVLVILMPLRGVTSLQSDVVERNVELLVMTKLTRWRIVMGKWLVICGQSWLVLVSFIPYFLVRYFMGQLDVGANLFGIVLLVGGNAAASALTIGASAYPGVMQRILIGGGGIGAMLMCAGIPAVVTLFLWNEAGGWMTSTGSVVATACAMSAFVLYATLGLQLGRARLRLALRRYEIPPSRGLIVLIFATPFLELMTLPMCLSLFGLAPLGINILFTVLAFQIDPKLPPRPARPPYPPIAPPPPAEPGPRVAPPPPSVS